MKRKGGTKKEKGVKRGDRIEMKVKKERVSTDWSVVKRAIR